MLSSQRNVIRKSTNLVLDCRIVTRAKELEIDISRIAEDGIAAAVREEEARLWKIDNRESIEEWNAYVEKNGLPLGRFRQF